MTWATGICSVVYRRYPVAASTSAGSSSLIRW